MVCGGHLVSMMYRPPAFLGSPYRIAVSGPRPPGLLVQWIWFGNRYDITLGSGSLACTADSPANIVIATIGSQRRKICEVVFNVNIFYPFFFELISPSDDDGLSRYHNNQQSLRRVIRDVPRPVAKL